MKYFGKVFVEFWDGYSWNLAALPWHKYLCGRLWGIIGNPGSDKDYRRVPRSKVSFQA